MAERVVAVAWSGGRDSTALLHATLIEAQRQTVRVVALHVHHGLIARADAWLAHCEAQSKRWARKGLPIEFLAHRLTSAPSDGDSVEAWARQERYRALRRMAMQHGASVVLLAQHQRDQAETLLLQALRGAGTAGLSGMPDRIVRDGIEWRRPWLKQSREAIDAYVQRHRLRHIEDDSNGDPRFARNRLRLQVWPALVDAFPHAEVALAMSARWAQEADAALGELAVLDLARVATDDGLQVREWLALSPARRSNALRSWIGAQHGSRAPASLVMRLLDELPTTRSARWPTDAGDLRLYRGVLRSAPSTQRHTHAQTPRPDREPSLSVHGEGVVALPGWSGALRVQHVEAMGVPLAWLAHAELRARDGGERFQAGVGRPPRSLKKQFQEAAVPAWDRSGPLVYSGGQLVFVPGLGLDARVIGLPGQPLVSLRWEPAERAAPDR